MADVFFIKIAVRSLFLNGNFFAEVPRSLRHVGDHLEYLNLNDNPIHEIDSQSFVGLSKLRELHLNAMDALTSIREHAFSPLHSLSILRCSYNPLLSFVHPKAFHELKRHWNVKEVSRTAYTIYYQYLIIYYERYLRGGYVIIMSPSVLSVADLEENFKILT